MTVKLKQNHWQYWHFCNVESSWKPLVTWVIPNQSVEFFANTQIGNIGIRGFTTWKQKKIQPQIALCIHTTWILDLLPSKICLNSSERRAWDSNGWGPRFNAHSCNILDSFLFWRSKVSDVDIANFGYILKASIVHGTSAKARRRNTAGRIYDCTI